MAELKIVVRSRSHRAAFALDAVFAHTNPGRRRTIDELGVRKKLISIKGGDRSCMNSNTHACGA